MTPNLRSKTEVQQQMKKLGMGTKYIDPRFTIQNEPYELISLGVDALRGMAELAGTPKFVDGQKVNFDGVQALIILAGDVIERGYRKLLNEKA